MVKSQLRPNRVTDARILSAMGDIPREMFLPRDLSGVAYVDGDLLVADDRYLMAPMVMARLMQEAGISETDRVLDISPASGYSTAVLAALALQVVAVEADKNLMNDALKNLQNLGVENAAVHSGDPVSGWPAEAPYDVIFLNGSVQALPNSLFEQLAEGGRMVSVFGPDPGSQAPGEARLYKKIYGSVHFRSLFNANIGLLPDFASALRFSF
ncbi:MAG: protein-L-isoaspartate O-methyltransferase [Alphaproteobacteria bacterium]|nr:protein-L-isoaspartate O-methyltransferase [Alphaproteobacteria bacterium]